jgi:uncharacterized repeat protein (TIGR03803 family)
MNKMKLALHPFVAHTVQFQSSTIKQILFYFLLFSCLHLTPLCTFGQFTSQQDLGSTANGANPAGAPVSDGTFLYGMTTNGGSSDFGTIYKVKLDGTGYTKLLDFNGPNGSRPYSSLIFVGGALYGMTKFGGSSGNGIVFKIMPDGTGFVDLLDFNFDTRGSSPSGSLVSDGTFLFGMTFYGGADNDGTVFRMMPDGTGFSKLHDFNYNSEGGAPNSSLYLNGSVLYGTTSKYSGGKAFKINTDGTGFTSIYGFSFSGYDHVTGPLISDNTSSLYGMTFYGGVNNYGTIFTMMPDGSGFTILHDFSIADGYPTGPLVFDGTFLYGMTTTGGSMGNGTIFKIKPDGSSYTKLLDNDVNSFSSNQVGALLHDGSTLYGTWSGSSTSSSGLGYLGTIFKINAEDGSGYSRLINYEKTGNEAFGSLFSDGTFHYGMTYSGGVYNYGTIFKTNLDGTGFIKLFEFDGANGSHPRGSLISDGTFLYGMTSSGGVNDKGIIFKIKTDGTNFVKLMDFNAASGTEPWGSLIIKNSVLYGMTMNGGSGYGTIFKLLPDGTGFTNLLDFDYATTGGQPRGSLVSDHDGIFLYGMTSAGGLTGDGTIFKIMPDGTFFKLLDLDYDTTGDGPRGDLLFDETFTFLYGMTKNGGSHSHGTIFKIEPDGTGYSKLLDFNGINTGSSPSGSLISDGVFLYGMTSNGGVFDQGTIFKMKNDGTSFVLLYEFSNAEYPECSLISDGTFIYGMTVNGGAFSSGTLFKSTMTPYVAVYDFKPHAGVVGTIVTIQGTDFDPVAANNIVKFNGIQAQVKSSTTSTLAVVVPFGATSGPITVMANEFTVASSLNFTVTTSSSMFNGSVQSCNTQFSEPGSGNVETFLPVNPTDKIKVVFSFLNAPDDYLDVYDGISTTPSSFLGTLHGTSFPSEIIAKSSEGALTFKFRPGDGSPSSWLATISCQLSSGSTISISKQPSDFSACAGDIATFSAAAEGTTNITYQWQYSPDGEVFSDVINGENYSNATTSTLSVNTAGNFGAGRYRCKIDGDLAPTVYTENEGLFINPVPEAPASSNVTNCGPGSVVLTASGGSDGDFLWYGIDGEISGQTNSTYTTPIISATTTYSVAITDGICVSTKVDVNAVIDNIPAAPSTLGASNCGAGSVTLSASGGTTENYLWYDTNGLISEQTNSTYTTPVISGTTTYSVAITDGTCTSPQTNVTAIINAIPTAPTTQGASQCLGTTFSLTASGGVNGSYTWYTTASGSSAIPGEVNSTYITPTLTSNTTYYVSINTNTCESLRTPVTATVITSGCSIPVITTSTLTTEIGGSITLSLIPLINTGNSNLDLNSIVVIQQPPSGAVVTITNGVATVNYSGINFSGTEQFTIRACDTDGNCATQVFTIQVAGNVVVYNGISPNGKNPTFIIEYINLLQDTKENNVYIFDRWENQVWHGTNYDNNAVVFTGVNDAGNDLPAGVYFYKISYTSGRKTETGFISLRRQ